MDGPRPEPSRLAREESFWASWFQPGEARPEGWEQAGPAERCLLAHADMQAALSEVIPFYLGRENQAGLWEFGRDSDAIAALVPRFAGILTRLMAAGTVQLRLAGSPGDTFRDAAALSPDRAAELAADPAAWLEDPDDEQRSLLLIGLRGRQTARPGELGLVVDNAPADIYRDHEL